MHQNKRLLSLLLAFVMVFSSIPFTFASEKVETSSQFDKFVDPKDKIDPNLLNDDSKEEKRVIIEFSKDPIIDRATKLGKSVGQLSKATYDSYSKEISNEQKSASKKIERTGARIDKSKTTEVILNQVTATASLEEIRKIAELPEVKNIFESRYYLRPEITPSMNNSDKLIKADEVWKRTISDGLTNIEGQGTVVAIVDTGIDFTHKDLKLTDPSKAKLTKEKVAQIGKDKGLSLFNNGADQAYYSDKVPYGFDYADGDKDFKDNKSAEPHGMHVAGTVGANGDPENGGIKGVAPETQLLGMKVFSDNAGLNGVYSDSYIVAIEDAIKLEADAINMSLGAPAGLYIGGSESPEQKVFKKATANGIVVAIAAGNDRNILDGTGLQMPKTNPDLGNVGSPSTYPESLSVASFENTHTWSNTIKISDGQNEMTYLASLVSASPLDKLPKEAEIVDVGLGKTEDYEGKEVAGKVALIQRGGITFTEKKDNAQKNGAIAAIVYNNKEGSFGMAIQGEVTIPLVSISQKDGEAIKANIDKIKVTFNGEKEFLENPEKDKMSVFSSWGPTSDLRMKPEITAPGGNIYSTLNDDTYGLMSGTSMATPHIAGASALLAQVLMDRGIAREDHNNYIKQLLMNTAEPIANPSGYTYSVMEQGAGLANVLNAINTKVRLNVTGTNDSENDPKLEIKSIGTESFEAVIELTNDSKEEIKFTPEVIALTEEIVDEKYTEKTTKVKASLDGDSEIVLNPNETKKVTYKVNFSGVERNQYIDGFILLKSENNPTLNVPFLGFYGDYSEPSATDGLVGFEESFFGKSYLTNKTGEFPLPIAEYKGEKVAFTNKSLGLNAIITFLRNAEVFRLAVEGPDGNEIKTINNFENNRKVYRISADNPPTTFDKWNYWDLSLRDGKLATEGEVYKVIFETKLNYDGKTQVKKYPLVPDYTGPEAQYLGYDEAKGEIVVTSKDALSGSLAIEVLDKDNKDDKTNSQLFKFRTEDAYKDFKEGGKIVFKLDDAFKDKENLVVYAYDRVTNKGKEVKVDFTKKIKADEDTGSTDDTIDDLKKLKAPYSISFITPSLARAMYDDKDPTKMIVAGNIGGAIDKDEIKSVQIDQIDTTTNKVIASGVGMPSNTKDGKVMFIGLIKPVPNPLIKLRVTIKADGRRDSVAAQIHLIDNEKPKMDVEAKCLTDGNIEFTFKVKDNFWHVEVYEQVPTSYGSWKDFQQVGVLDKSDGPLGGYGMEGEFTKVLPAQKGVNTYKFVARDLFGNESSRVVEVNTENGCGQEYKKSTQNISGIITFVNDNKAVRPTSLKLNLYKKGETEVLQSITVEPFKYSPDSTMWFYSFPDEVVVEDEEGNSFEYDVKLEEIPAGYEVSYGLVRSTSITLTYTGQVNPDDPNTTVITGEKKWVGDAPEERPEEITVGLYKGVTKPELIEKVTTNKEKGWKYSFSKVPVNDESGVPILYSVYEDEVEGYTSEWDKDNPYNIVNTKITGGGEDPGQVGDKEIKGKVFWVGDEGHEDKRPAEVTIKLYSGSYLNKKYVAETTTSADKNWEYTFKNLKKYDENNKFILYYLSGEAEGYHDSPLADSNASLDDVCLVYDGEEEPGDENQKELKGKVEWPDENATNLPKTLKVKLLKGSEFTEVTEVTTSADKKWEYSFGKQDINDENGLPIFYTAEGEDVYGYIQTISPLDRKLDVIYEVFDEEEPEELNKTELQKLVDSAKKIDLTNKTEESKKALEEAIKKAEEALENATSQEEIDKAKEALEKAIEGLKEKPQKPVDPTPGEVPGTDPIPGEKPGTKPDPKPEVKPEPKPEVKPEKNIFDGIEKERQAGDNRYKTAVEISKKNFESAETVILVNGEKEADALAASVLAKEKNAPILLIKKDMTPDEVAKEIERLGAKNIILIGGLNSVTQKAVENLKLDLNRIAGKDRFETAVEIAKAAGKTEKLILANGQSLVDALTASSLAQVENRGIILVNKDSIPECAKELVEKAKDILIVGGENSVKLGVKADRISGKDRFETAVKIAERAFVNPKQIALANSTAYADALVFGGVTGKVEAPILLTNKDKLPQVVKEYLERNQIEKIFVLGGENSVSENLFK